MARPRARAVVAVVLLVLLVLLGVWGTTGWSCAVLASRSMEPWAVPGDLLVHRHVPASAVEVGDVVTVQTPDRGLVTNRVVRLTPAADGTVSAQLKGDRSWLPDPVPVQLAGEVATAVLVVPRLGDVLTIGAPLLWSGLSLLLLGGTALLLQRDRSGPGTDDVPAPAGEGPDRETAPTADPRIEALLASCEQFAEDGMPATVVRDLVRVRTADVLGLPSAERAGVVLELDDGSLFYVVALADADPDALAIVPVGSTRRQAATAALDVWWNAIHDRVPETTAASLHPWT